MFVRTETKGIAKEAQHEVMIFSLAENSPDVLMYTVGDSEIVINSNLDSWGNIPVSGSANLKLLRDAFIAICEKEGIE